MFVKRGEEVVGGELARTDKFDKLKPCFTL